MSVYERISSLYMLNPDTRRVLRYDIKRQLGEGAGGVVLLADKYVVSGSSEEGSNVETVAIKVADTLRRKSHLCREAQILRQLMDRPARSSRIVRIHEDSIVLEECDVHEDGSHTERKGGIAAIELEYLRGQTLASWMHTEWFPREGVPTFELVEVGVCHIIDLLDALIELTSLPSEGQIWHRDVKPENIMVTGNGLCLFDFNAARERDQHSGLTHGIGTPGYQAPEVRFGPEYDGRADLFSVGVILWEALHQRRFTSEYPEFLPLSRPNWVVDWPTERFAELEPTIQTVLAHLMTQLLCHMDTRFADAHRAHATALSVLEAIRHARAPALPDLNDPEAPDRDTTPDPVDALSVVDALMELRPNGQAAVVADVDPDTLGTIQRHIRESTRVDDPLEEYLRGRVTASLDAEEGSPRLLLLGGNAGDGKSYLIDRLVHDLLSSEQRKHVHYIADATHSLRPSQSQQERLEAFFAPFATGAKTPPAPDGLHLIAMNTGMVIKFFEEAGAENDAHPLAPLYHELQRQFGLLGDNGAFEYVVEVINLDLRSMLRSMRSQSQPFFTQMLDRLDPEASDGLIGPKMALCADCSARDVCPVAFNLRALRAGQPARAALVRLMERVELNPEVHLSPRNLWGFFYRLLTGGLERYDVPERQLRDMPCDVIRRKADPSQGGGQDSAWLLDGHFYVTAFAHAELGGMWSTLSHLDPAFASSFRIDSLHTRFSIIPNLDSLDDDEYLDLELGATHGILAGTALKYLLATLPSEYPAARRRNIAVRRHVFFDPKTFTAYDRDVTSLVSSNMLPFEDLLRAYRTYSVDPTDPSKLTREQKAGIQHLTRLVREVVVRAYGRMAGPHTLLRVSQPNTRTNSRLFIKADGATLDDSFMPRRLIYPDVHVAAHHRRGRYQLIELYGYLPDTLTLDVAGYRLVVDEDLYGFLHEVSLGKQPSALDMAQFQSLRYAGERLGNVLASQTGGRPSFFILNGDDGRLFELRRDGFGEPVLNPVDGVTP